MNPDPQRPSGRTEADDADLFDYALIRDWIVYFLGSLRRRKLVMAAVFVAVVGAGMGMVSLMPKVYSVEGTLLAQRNQLMASLGNPYRTVPGDADAPTRAASELVRSRENLVSLIKQTNLMDEWDRTRAPILRIKDSVMQALRGPMDEEEKLDALVGVLEQRLWVSTGDGTVTIGINWPDAQGAARLVEAAVQNFLETRHVAEVSTIAETISILEGHASDVRDSIQNVQSALRKKKELQKETEQRVVREEKRAAPRDPQAAQLEVMLAAKKRAIADLEDFRRRRLVELQGQLAEQRAVYAEAHPVIQNLRQSIASLSAESPQVLSLRADERRLQGELDRRKATLAEAAEAQKRPATATVKVASLSMETPEMPAGLEYDEQWLTLAMNKYNGLLERIDAAKIELDTARAAFKYRYSLVRPPQVPRKPVKPNVPKLMVAAVGAGVFLAAMVAFLLDLRSRRILEPWQVERQLGVKLLGRLRES